MAKVGFIGLGVMGAPMAANLQRQALMGGFAASRILEVHGERHEPARPLGSVQGNRVAVQPRNRQQLRHL